MRLIEKSSRERGLAGRDAGAQELRCLTSAFDLPKRGMAHAGRMKEMTLR